MAPTYLRRIFVGLTICARSCSSAGEAYLRAKAWYALLPSGRPSACPFDSDVTCTRSQGQLKIDAMILKQANEPSLNGLTYQTPYHEMTGEGVPCLRRA